jgi:hypothetical protein
VFFFFGLETKQFFVKCVNILFLFGKKGIQFLQRR